MDKSIKRAKFKIELIFLSLFFYLIIFLSFEQIRNLFPPASSANNTIISYAQFFGYPMYFDQLFFFALVLVPSLSYILLMKLRSPHD